MKSTHCDKKADSSQPKKLVEPSSSPNQAHFIAKRAMKGSHHANSEYQYAREDLHGDRRQFRYREGNRAGAGTDGCNRRDGLPGPCQRRGSQERDHYEKQEERCSSPASRPVIATVHTTTRRALSAPLHAPACADQ